MSAVNDNIAVTIAIIVLLLTPMLSGNLILAVSLIGLVCVALAYRKRLTLRGAMTATAAFAIALTVALVAHFVRGQL